MKSRRRLLVVGLDGAEPSMVFGRLAPRLPALTRLGQSGGRARLQSTVPPSTIPAWMSMFTGCDPGRLGVYGFRNRGDHGYGPLRLASSRSISAPWLWDRLSAAGLTSFLLGVPGTYPPWPIRGRMVSSFLAPGAQSAYTHPPELGRQVEALAGGSLLDIEGFRTEEKARLHERIRRATRRRFRVARAWAAQPDWDLLVVVEMGTDRMHHLFWRHFDPAHRLHRRGGRFESAIPDYYAEIDAEVAALIAAAGPGVEALVVSDHGARALEGGFRVNQWLIAQGDLALRETPGHPRPLAAEMIDWSRTRAWGEGGYHARIFLNLEGREPRGALPAGRVEAYRADLAARLEATTDERGAPLGTRVLFPERVYSELRGVPPDLMVYFGDLAWRAIAAVGAAGVHSRSNDTGPDDANHSAQGIYISSLPGPPDGDLSILDVAPRILDFFGLPGQ